MAPTGKMFENYFQWDMEPFLAMKLRSMDIDTKVKRAEKRKGDYAVMNLEDIKKIHHGHQKVLDLLQKDKQDRIDDRLDNLKEQLDENQNLLKALEKAVETDDTNALKTISEALGTGDTKKSKNLKKILDRKIETIQGRLKLLREEEQPTDNSREYDDLELWKWYLNRRVERMTEEKGCTRETLESRAIHVDTPDEDLCGWENRQPARYEEYLNGGLYEEYLMRFNPPRTNREDKFLLNQISEFNDVDAYKSESDIADVVFEEIAHDAALTFRFIHLGKILKEINGIDGAISGDDVEEFQEALLSVVETKCDDIITDKVRPDGIVNDDDVPVDERIQIAMDQMKKDFSTIMCDTPNELKPPSQASTEELVYNDTGFRAVCNAMNHDTRYFDGSDEKWIWDADEDLLSFVGLKKSCDLIISTLS